MCAGRSPTGLTSANASPSEMHHTAVADGSVDPNGNGAKATVEKSSRDESLFAGGSLSKFTAMYLSRSDVFRQRATTFTEINFYRQRFEYAEKSDRLRRACGVILPPHN